jgi:hypothetical protein
VKLQLELQEDIKIGVAWEIRKDSGVWAVMTPHRRGGLSSKLTFVLLGSEM